MARTCSITMASMVGRAPAVDEQCDLFSYVCLFDCLSRFGNTNCVITETLATMQCNFQNNCGAII